MHQGVVHTSLRFRSRICNNPLVERLLFRAWNFSHLKQASSQHRRLEVMCRPSKVYDVFPYPVPKPPACQKSSFFSYHARAQASSRVKFRLRSPAVERTKDAENTKRSTKVAKELFHKYFRGKKSGTGRQERVSRSFEIFLCENTKNRLSLFCVIKQ